MKLLLLLLAFACLPFEGWAQAQKRVAVDFSSLPKTDATSSFRAGTGIRGINVGMSMDEAKTALVGQGFNITDQRLVVFQRVFAKNGIDVVASSERFEAPAILPTTR